MNRLGLVRAAIFVSFLSLLGPCSWAQACPPNQWCRIYDRPLLRNNGYNNVIFASDVHSFILYAGNSNVPSTAANGPEATTFWKYTVHDAATSANPWQLLSDCNDNAKNELRQQSFQLNQNISATDKQAEFCVGRNCAGTLTPQNAIPQSGVAWISDESFAYKGCSGVVPETPESCGAGTKKFRLENLERGIRQASGWRSPYAHNSGEPFNLSCLEPTLAGSPTGDHPPSRHIGGNVTYDSLRGAIWLAWGWQENWSLQDTWYLCVFQTSFCSADKITKGWQRLPLYSSGGVEPGTYTENATVYDPANDVLVSFGGLRAGNPTPDTFVFCLSAKAYGCSENNLQKWVKVSTHGSPGSRDAARLAYDNVNHRVLAFGGLGREGTLYNSVAIYDSAKGDWCVSDTSVGDASNASSCKLPSLSGTAPPRDRANKFPAWTFDTKRGKGAYFNGRAVYEYDAARNRWDMSEIPAGPAAGSSPQQSHQSWAYDDAHDTFVWVSVTQLWQLPGAALSVPQPPRKPE